MSTKVRNVLILVALAAIVLALGFGLGREARRPPTAKAARERAGVRTPDWRELERVRGADESPASAASEPAPPTLTGPGAASAPVYHARPADEWQGMAVNEAMQATCDTSMRCGLAMACHEGRCGACTADADCAGGEVCALDHCVKQELAACRHRSDCEGAALCVLSGYSPDARGNGDMSATCRADGGGTAPAAPEQVARPETRPAAPAAVDPAALLASLRDAAE